MNNGFTQEQAVTKWAEVLDHDELSPITESHRRGTTAVLLENTERALGRGEIESSTQLLGEAAPANQTGANIDNYDPVLVSLVRRTAPNLMAYDICGVQAMTGPTQLIFAMRSRLDNQTGAETFYNEVDTSHTNPELGGTDAFGDNHTGPGYPTGDLATYNTGTGMSTAQAEALGTDGATAIPEVAFSIEKVSVTAKSRALKAEYTIELAQDLKAIHGLDAETELSNILQTELLAEINREVVRTIGITAIPGAQQDTTTAGTFDLDTDSNGRWMAEKFKGILFQIEREANQIAKDTRRGKGNIVVCSSDVASALSMTGQLDYTPALSGNNLNVDDTGQTFAGILSGRYRVYIDPYATGNYLIVGYKGNNSNFDAGLFYCPYVPLQQVRAVDQGSFQPKIGFKTRYGMVANPFAEGATAGLGAITANTNKYYRRVLVSNIM